MTDKYYGLRRRKTFDEMLKEAMTHRLKIEIILERRAFDTSINDIDFDDFSLSKYDRRLRLNARVQTDKQVLLHELTPDMFDEIPPSSQLYENNEADTQTTRYVAKELDDEKFSDVITDKSEENRKSEDEPEGVKDNDLKQSDEKQEDLQSLHLTSSSSSVSTEKDKKEESREIKSLRNIFLGGEDKSVFELFQRGEKSSTPSEQSREQEEEQPRASFWPRRQVEARSRSHSPEERARGNQMNRRQLETRSRSNSPQEIARGSEWTREQMETRSRSRSPKSTNTKSSRGKKKK